MAAGDRSLSDVLQDIIRNAQEIVRSEVRLAKTEVWQEAAKAKSSAVLLGAGAVTALFAMFFLLLMGVYALALVIPAWAAALVVAAALGIVASVMLAVGVSRFQRIHKTPERTVKTMKENIQWAKQLSK